MNHVGESDGTVTQFRLQDMELDLAAVLQQSATDGPVVLSVWWPPVWPVALLSKSPRGTSHVKLLVLINGIMDVRHTLQAVHQEDLIGEHLAGMRKGVVNVFWSDYRSRIVGWHMLFRGIMRIWPRHSAMPNACGLLSCCFTADMTRGWTLRLLQRWRRRLGRICAIHTSCRARCIAFKRVPGRPGRSIVRLRRVARKNDGRIVLS